MEATRGINEHCVGTAVLGCLQGVKDHRTWIRTWLVRDDFCSYLVAPPLELIDCCCSEGISSSQDDLLAVSLKAISQLGDAGGLA